MIVRENRLPSRVLVHVRIGDGGFDATIGNLSTRGARLVGVPDGWRGQGPGQMLGQGARVQIQCAGVVQGAEVRWRVDDTCGLQFDQPLDARTITDILSSRRMH